MRVPEFDSVTPNATVEKAHSSDVLGILGHVSPQEVIGVPLVDTFGVHLHQLGLRSSGMQ